MSIPGLRSIFIKSCEAASYACGKAEKKYSKSRGEDSKLRMAAGFGKRSFRTPNQKTKDNKKKLESMQNDAQIKTEMVELKQDLMEKEMQELRKSLNEFNNGDKKSSASPSTKKFNSLAKK